MMSNDDEKKGFEDRPSQVYMREHQKEREETKKFLEEMRYELTSPTDFYAEQSHQKEREETQKFFKKMKDMYTSPTGFYPEQNQRIKKKEEQIMMSNDDEKKGFEDRPSQVYMREHQKEREETQKLLEKMRHEFTSPTGFYAEQSRRIREARELLNQYSKMKAEHITLLRRGK